MEALALLTDVKGSRHLRERQSFFEELQRALEEVNEEHEDSLVAPLEFQKGLDELGAIVDPQGDIGQILIRLWTAFHPVEARFALVEGPLDLVPESDEPSVRLYDGPALHAAAAAIEAMKRQRRPLHLEHTGTYDERLSLYGSLLYLRILDWTPRQLTIFQAYREGIMQREIGERYGITQPTVSELLGKTRAPLTSQALDRFAHDVDSLLGET